jgi:hypothetical protein
MTYIYGFCCELGFGVERNAVAAIECYRRGAICGSPEAMYRLSLCLRDGVGIEQNQSIALDVLKAAADGGHGDAECDYGCCLECGIGCSVDRAGSIVYLTRAAVQGNVNAQLKIMTIVEEFAAEIEECREEWRRGLIRDDLSTSIDTELPLLDRTVSAPECQRPTTRGYPTGWTRFFEQTI